EIPNGHIDVSICGMAYGRDVARTVPRRPYVEPFAETCHLHRGCNSTDLGDVNTNVVEHAVGHVFQPLVLIVEQFAHGKGYAGLPAQQGEPSHILGRERIFNEEGTVFFESPDQVDGVHRLQAFVDIVKQLYIVADCFSDEVKDRNGTAFVYLRVDRVILWCSKIVLLIIRLRRQVRGSISAQLNSHVSKTLADKFLNLFEYSFWRWTTGMRIGVDCESAFTAQQLINRYPQQFTLDVPQGLIQSAQCVVQHRAVTPVGTYIGGLPDVFDIMNVLAPAKVVEILIDCRYDSMRTLTEGGASQTVQTVLVGFHFYHHQFDSIRCRRNSRHLSNLYRRQCRARRSCCPRRRCCRCKRQEGKALE